MMKSREDRSLRPRPLLLLLVLILFTAISSPSRAQIGAQIDPSMPFQSSSSFGIWTFQEPSSPQAPVTGSWDAEYNGFGWLDPSNFDVPIQDITLEIDGYVHTQDEVRIRYIFEDNNLVEIDVYNAANGVAVGPGPDFLAVYSITEVLPLQYFEFTTDGPGSWSAIVPLDEIYSNLIMRGDGFAPGLTKGGERELCHSVGGAGEWVKVTVPGPARIQHVRRHDDGVPGGLTFESHTLLDDDCKPLTPQDATNYD